MAKILSSDLMLLNREDADGNRSIYSYNGIDFGDSVQEVIDNNRLYDIYVNMDGDDMSGVLTIDVNKELVNPENLLCLDVEGRINSKQIYFDPSNNDAAHISMYFQGERDHLIYYEKHINIVDRIQVGDEIDDKVVLQIERDGIHAHTDFAIGVSTVQPSIRLNNDGTALFTGKILLSDIADLDYNDAVHRGYVDDSTDELRQEIIQYVSVDVLTTNNFKNVNIESTIQYGLDRFSYNSSEAVPGAFTIKYVEPDPLGVQQTNWESVESFTINKTLLNADTIGDEVYETGRVIKINFAEGPEEDQYECATYNIIGVVDNGDSLTISVEHAFTAEGDPPNAIDNSPYLFGTTQLDQVSTLYEGMFYWVTIPNSVDTQGDEVDDWRAVNELYISLKDNDGNEITTQTYKNDATLDVTSIDPDGDGITSGSFIIKNSELTTITQIDEASFVEIDVPCIKLTVEMTTAGDTVGFRPGVIHTLRSSSPETLQTYFDRSDAELDSKIETNISSIEALQDDVLQIERAFSKGRLKYISASGTTGNGRFSLNDNNGSAINTFSNSNITKIYLSINDINQGLTDWTAGLGTTEAVMLFSQANQSGVLTPGHGEFLINSYQDNGDHVEFDVTFASGSTNVNDTDSEYNVKITSKNEGITTVEAYDAFVNKTGDSNMYGSYSIKDESGSINFKIDDIGTLTLGNSSTQTDATLNLRGDTSTVNFNLSPVFVISSDDVVIEKPLNLNDNMIRGVKTPSGNDDTEVANVGHVKTYVEDTIATESSTGGIKIRSPFSMDGDFLDLGRANVASLNSVSAEDMGIAAYNSLTFEMSVVNDTKLITARTLPTYNNYGMVKISTPMIITSGGHLTVKTSGLLVHEEGNDGRQLTVRTATTSRTGVVQLNDNINHTSSTQAATAKAVKTAYDKAKQAYDSLFKPGNKVVSGNVNNTYSGGFYESAGNLYWKV